MYKHESATSIDLEGRTNLCLAIFWKEVVLDKGIIRNDYDNMLSITVNVGVYPTQLDIVRVFYKLSKLLGGG